MHGHSVAIECIDDEYIEVLEHALLRLVLKHYPRITQHNVDTCCAIINKGEILARNTLYIRIDFVEAQAITALGQRSNGADAQTNNSDSKRFVDWLIIL